MNPSIDHEVDWSRLTAARLRERAAANAILILPVGATEQHGPHLPVMVDSRIVRAVAIDAARRIALLEPAVVAPALPFGLSEHHVSIGGALTLDLATYAAVLGCLCDSAIRQGFRRIFILNGHGGNAAALEAIVGSLTIEHRLPIATAAYWRIAETAIAAILERQAGVLHACEAETSMMMALEPGLVAPSVPDACRGELVPGAAAIAGVDPAIYRWRQLGTRSTTGVVGEAGAATPEKGRRLLDAIAAALAVALTAPELWSAPI
ncbi:MAG: creatininase family protein [Geminicoccaceae bacterium]